PAPAKPVDLLPAFAVELADPAVGFADLIWAIPILAPHLQPGDAERMQPAIRRRFGAAETEVATAYLAAWDLREAAALARLAAALGRLGEVAARPDPVPYARFAAGRIRMERKDYAVAVDRFRMEGDSPEARESRYMAIAALQAARDFPALARLQLEPAYRGLF